MNNRAKDGGRHVQDDYKATYYVSESYRSIVFAERYARVEPEGGTCSPRADGYKTAVLK